MKRHVLWDNWRFQMLYLQCDGTGDARVEAERVDDFTWCSFELGLGLERLEVGVTFAVRVILNLIYVLTRGVSRRRGVIEQPALASIALVLIRCQTSLAALVIWGALLDNRLDMLLLNGEYRLGRNLEIASSKRW